MANPNPDVSLFLDGDLSFHFNGNGKAGTSPRMKVQMHDSKKDVILSLPGYDAMMKTIDLAVALQSGFFQLVDTTTDTKVDLSSVPSVIYPETESDDMHIQAGARIQWVEINLKNDSFWKAALQEGHSYGVRWATPDRLPPHWISSRTPAYTPFVRCLPRPIKLYVYTPDTAPPEFQISLEPTSPTCHLSGEPPFGIRLTITNTSADPITFNLAGTPLRQLHSLEDIIKLTTIYPIVEVEWPSSYGCFPGSGSAQSKCPSDEMFETFEPGSPFERTFWLKKEDEKTGNGGELDVLEAGKAYWGVPSQVLLRGFEKWMKGRKEDLLAVDEEKKKERWKGAGGKLLWDVAGKHKMQFEIVE